MNKSRIIFLGIFILLVTGLFFVVLNQKVEAPIQWKEARVGGTKPLEKESGKEAQVVIEKKETPIEKTVPSPTAPLPEKVLIPMPFTTQSPFANWDERHEEACEEASLLMVAYFLQGKKLNPTVAENELQKMIDFQLKYYGFYKDSTGEQIVTLAKDYFSIKNLKVVYDFKKEEIKKELAKGNPIIILAAGRELGNPNFSGLGPPYHVLVAKGYEGNTIITNDPGTKRGEGYRYDLDTLYYAIHDFPGSKERILEGRKAMIVIEGEN